MTTEEKQRMQRVLRQVAEKNGVSVEKVRREIAAAIQIGMQDPAAREQWAAMPKEGDVPTPEEVILYLSREARRNDSM